MHTQRSARNIALAGIAILMGALVVVPSTGLSKGKPQPFRIKGTVVSTPRADTPTTGKFDIVDVGEATHLGLYRNTGWLQYMMVEGKLVILDGAGQSVAANGKDYNTWHMEPLTGRVIFDGGVGRFAGMSGYFDSTITSMTINPDGSGESTYTGIGEVTFPR